MKKILIALLIFLVSLPLIIGLVTTIQIPDAPSKNVKTSGNYLIIDGVKFTKDKKTLVSYPSTRQGADYTIPDGVKYILAGAFEDAKYLQNVVIPASVQEIGKYIFSQRLNSIRFMGDRPDIGYLPGYDSLENFSYNKMIRSDANATSNPKIYYYEGKEGFDPREAIQLFSFYTYIKIFVFACIIAGGILLFFMFRKHRYFEKTSSNWDDDYQITSDICDVKNLNKEQAYSVFMSGMNESKTNGLL